MALSEIEIFNFNSNEVRIVLIDDEPWFVLNDVCVVMGLRNARDVADRLPKDCVGQTDIVDGRGQGLPVEKTHSTIFGDVNTWPTEVWDEASSQIP